MAGSWLDKAKDFVKGNPQQADSALDKVEDILDKQTGGKYSDQIDQGADALRDKLGLPQEQPEPAPAPAPEPAPAPAPEPAPAPAPEPAPAPATEPAPAPAPEPAPSPEPAPAPAPEPAPDRPSWDEPAPTTPAPNPSPSTGDPQPGSSDGPLTPGEPQQPGQPGGPLDPALRPDAESGEEGTTELPPFGR